MRRSRFSEDAIIGILKEHAAVASAPVMLHQGANDRFWERRRAAFVPSKRQQWAGLLGALVRPLPTIRVQHHLVVGRRFVGMLAEIGPGERKGSIGHRPVDF